MSLEIVTDVDDGGGWAALGVAAALVLVAGCSSAGGESKQASGGEGDETQLVEAVPVERVTQSKQVKVPATLAATRTLQVTPEVGGVVKRLHVDQGDSVEEGAPLVRISSVDYDLAVASAKSQKEAAQAAIDQAKARYETAKNQYERFKELYEADVVAKSQFEEVKAAYEQAKAGYESAKAQARQATTGVEQAMSQVDDTVIRAPFDGHVVRRMVDEGSVVRPMASPVMVLVDDDPIRAEASVGELDLPNIEKGMEAAVGVDAYPETTFEGEVSMVNRQVDPRTREAAIRVELPNEEGRLRVGMSGAVTIRIGERERLVVPRRSIVDRRGSEAAVFVVESGRAQRRPVVIEAGFEAEVPVAKGLDEGERVVTWGADRIRDGDAVEVKENASEKSADESGDGGAESGGGER